MEEKNEKDKKIKEEEEIDLFEYFLVLKKHWRLIFLIFFITTSTTFVVSKFFLPKIYRAKATILPPEEEPLRGIPFLREYQAFAPLLGVPTKTDRIVGILKSQRMRGIIVKEFNLKDYYKVDYICKAEEILEKNTQIKVTKEGIIEVYFTDKNSQLCADIANFYVTYLDELNRQFYQSSTRRQRIFIEERLKETQEKLKEAEDNLERFKKETKIIHVDAQTEALINQLSLLEADFLANKIKLKVMQYSSAENNPEIQRLKIQIAEQQKKLNQIKYGEFEHLPELSKKLAFLVREVKLQDTLFSLLSQMYEKLKIEEIKDIPTFCILDFATVPELPYKPKVKLNVMISGILALFFAVFLVFFIEGIQRRKNLV